MRQLPFPFCKRHNKNPSFQILQTNRITYTHLSGGLLTQRDNNADMQDEIAYPRRLHNEFVIWRRWNVSIPQWCVNHIASNDALGKVRHQF